ncbi:hypothetical protein MXB_319 [Myxobolus squamalis]|nr:hypothetical protein MXB_319 [Myxobolus squamalis]
MEKEDNSVNKINVDDSSFKLEEESTVESVLLDLPTSIRTNKNSGDEAYKQEIVHTSVEDSESNDEPPEKIIKTTNQSIDTLPPKKTTLRKPKKTPKRKLHISHPYPMEYYYPCEKLGNGIPDNQSLCNFLRKQQKYAFKHLPREKRGFDAAIYNRHLEKIEWGDLFVFGQGDSGQLGLGPDVLEVAEPTLVKFDAPIVFKEVISGGLHTVVLSHLGDVYSCGCNDEGALGRNGPIGLKEAYKIEHKPVVVFNRPDFAVSINAGNNHLIILTTSGKIFTCGCAEDGQLGRLSYRLSSDRGGRFGLKLLLTPTIVYLSGGATPKELELKKHSSLSMEEALYKIYEPGKSMGYDIAGGVQHTVFVDYNSRPLAMGDCRDGRLGRIPCNYNDCSHDKSQPLPIHLASTHNVPIGFKSSGAMQFHTVACGDACTLVITGKGELYSWGVGCNLQLGIGNGKDLYEATRVDVKSLKDQEVLYTSSGAQHSVFSMNLII